MPITIPPFDQYQQPITPLRGLWNARPAEGDMMVLATIDWLTTTTGRAVQFAFAGNSPVPLSQIVALAVDNRNSGYDVDFVFPDSGFTLTVPAYNQLIAPVFTNALMFYVVAAPGVVVGNQTTFMVLNSMPPPVSINPTRMQTKDGIAGVIFLPGSSTPLVPATVSGTLNGLIISLQFSKTVEAVLQLVDGTGAVLWEDHVHGIEGVAQQINISNLDIRFVNGVNLLIPQSSVPDGFGGFVNMNVFYTTP